MARKMEFTLGDETGIVEFYEDDAPKTVDAVWRMLPWSVSSAQHARFSGHEVFCAGPKMLEGAENMRYDVEHGDVGYFWQSGGIVCWYDDVEVITPANVFGHIVENLEGIQKNARQTWFESGVKMELKKLEE